MGFLDDKKTAAALIIRKMSSPSDYESMKADNEQMKQVPMKDGAEQEASIGLMSACEEMMRATEMKDASKFKMALDSYLQMRDDMREAETDSTDD